jgi:phosphoribosylanthranilate isomerase
LFRIKICGITSVADGRMVAAAGADAIGLNFFAGSSRYVSLAAARSIVACLPAHVSKVGVFVNAGLDEMRQAHDDLGLDFVQLHGDEPDALIDELEGAGRQVIRAVRCSAASFETLIRFRDRRPATLRGPSALLVDAFRPGEYGGTGLALDWRALRAAWEPQPAELPPSAPSAEPQSVPSPPRIPLILAGGLTAGNVGEAIRLARPYAVDTASGVEISPGRKDADKVAAFVLAARSAFDPASGPSRSDRGTEMHDS